MHSIWYAPVSILCLTLFMMRISILLYYYYWFSKHFLFVKSLSLILHIVKGSGFWAEWIESYLNKEEGIATFECSNIRRAKHKMRPMKVRKIIDFVPYFIVVLGETDERILKN